jgi:hypothetical protein
MTQPNTAATAATPAPSAPVTAVDQRKSAKPAGGQPPAAAAPPAAATAAQAPAKMLVDPKPVVPLEPANARLAEAARNVWRIDVVPTLTPPDLLATGYWANVADRFRHGDMVEAEAEDRSWLAMYMVVDAGKNWARVALIWAVRLDARGPDINDKALTGFAIDWSGNVGKWRVIRLADRKVIQDKFETKAAADTWFSQWAAAQLR